MSKIITISGQAQNGKDTFAIFLQNKLEENNKTSIIFHYADLLKFICKQYFNWNGEKNEDGRTLLQYVGTEIGRKHDENFWVKVSSLIINTFFENYDYIIIPDCRFPNEIDYWEDKIIAAIHVTRINFENNLTKEQKDHVSETALDDYKGFTHYIEAENLEELREAANWIKDECVKNL